MDTDIIPVKLPAKKAEALIIGFDDEKEPFANKPNLKNRIEKSKQALESLEKPQGI